MQVADTPVRHITLYGENRKFKINTSALMLLEFLYNVIIVVSITKDRYELFEAGLVLLFSI